MRLPRTLWFVPALLACTLQIALASPVGSSLSPIVWCVCGKDQKGSAGQLLKNDRTVLVSVMLTNSGLVRDVRVLSGPTTLGQAAIKAVRQRRYSDKAVWGTTPAGNSMRHVWLAVTVPREKGKLLKVRPGTPPVAPCCVQVGLRLVVVLPPSVLPSSLTSWQPVMPVLAAESKE